MARRIKEVCQITLVGFLLYVLSLEETEDNDLAYLRAISNNDQETKSDETTKKGGDGYKLSALTKMYLMKLGNQTKFPSTLHTDFLIKPNNVCPYNKSVDYLVIVNSAPDNFERRLAIRNTFGQNNLFGHLIHRLVFLLGWTPDIKSTQSIKEEAMQFNDIVKGDFLDSYHNLTLKGVMGLRWINESCPNPKLVVKIDDDVFLNVFRVVSHWIPKFRKHRYRTMGCELLLKGKSKIYRNHDEKKWQVDQKLFPGFDSFPFPHCKGYYVAMSGDLIEPMLEVAKITPFFWIDDVYMYGLLPLTIGGVRMGRFWRYTTDSYSYAMYCIRKGVDTCQYVVMNVGNNNFKKEIFYNLWSNITFTLTAEQKKAFHWKEDI